MVITDQEGDYSHLPLLVGFFVVSSLEAGDATLRLLLLLIKPVDRKRTQRAYKGDYARFD